MGGVCLRGTLWQHNRDLNFVICNTLPRAFEEWNFKHKVLAVALPSDKVHKVVVPASNESVVPATKDRITGLEFEVCFAEVGAEAGGGHVTNLIGEVGIFGTNGQWEGELLDGRGGGIVVARSGPGDTGELFLKSVILLIVVREVLGKGDILSSVVGHPVMFLDSEIATPMAHLDKSLHTLHFDHRVSILESKAHSLTNSLGFNHSVGTESELIASLGRIFRSVGLGCELSEVRNLIVGKLQFGLLLLGHVRSQSVLVTSPLQELFLDLGHKGGDRSDDVSHCNADLESDRFASGECWSEENAVILYCTVSSDSLAFRGSSFVVFATISNLPSLNSTGVTTNSPPEPFLSLAST